MKNIVKQIKNKMHDCSLKNYALKRNCNKMHSQPGLLILEIIV